MRPDFFTLILMLIPYFRRKLSWPNIPEHCFAMPLKFPLSPTDPCNRQTPVLKVLAHLWDAADSTCPSDVLLTPLSISLLPAESSQWPCHFWDPPSQRARTFAEGDSARIHPWGTVDQRAITHVRCRPRPCLIGAKSAPNVQPSRPGISFDWWHNDWSIVK